jgi:Alpha/beta hydrolase family
MIGVVKKPYLYGGLALVAVTGWALTAAGGAITSGHWSYRAMYLVAATLGVVAVVLAVLWRSSRTRIVLAGSSTVGLALLATLAWWLTPFEATERALVALESGGSVQIVSSASAITMTPTGTSTGVGVIFQPGARIDARAYARILRPIAEAGHHVVIAKQPLGVAFLATGFASDWAIDHPEIGSWVVAGHSLGGVVAADNAADTDAIDGLVLWASLPASDLSDRGFAALSVFGSNDGLTSTDEIEASIDDLPDTTTFVWVAGAVHSHFGDYGSQPGDGEPGVSREEAQRLIVEATLEFLAR